ncbi:hypothetical protein [Olivibacter sp. XZL3]|uniref:hypothetical protein n=1 Tax=Olivibacter sp. XZL3 TaxID=1735116 RepID=UPI001066FF44|nr:hypothetical protein [Olivibacter sp. XZL3]
MNLPKLKVGDMVKYHTPYPRENPNDLYIVLEAHYDVERPRAKLLAYAPDFNFALTYVRFIEELELADVISVSTTEIEQFMKEKAYKTAYKL